MEDYGSFSTKYLFIAFSDANGTVVDDDWNVKWVLMQDGYETVVYEPEDGWITHTVPMNSLKRTKRYREEVKSSQQNQPILGRRNNTDSYFIINTTKQKTV